jgi:hypothetical protein
MSEDLDKKSCLLDINNSKILFMSKWHPKKYISVLTNEYINITSDIIDENVGVIGTLNGG